MEKWEPCYADGWDVNWYSQYGEQYGGFSEKEKIELSDDPAIPLLGVYLKEMQ